MHGSTHIGMASRERNICASRVLRSVAPLRLDFKTFIARVPSPRMSLESSTVRFLAELAARWVGAPRVSCTCAPGGEQVLLQALAQSRVEVGGGCGFWIPFGWFVVGAVVGVCGAWLLWRAREADNSWRLPDLDADGPGVLGDRLGRGPRLRLLRARVA